MASERIAGGGALATYSPLQANVNRMLGMLGLPSVSNQQLMGFGGTVQGAVKGAGQAVAGGAKGALPIAGRFAPLIGAGVGVATGDYGGAVGSLAGGALGSLAGPVGAIAGSMIGGAVGGTAQKAIAGLVGGGQERQLLRGESTTALGIGEGKGIESLSIDQIRELARVNPEIAQELNSTMNQNLDLQMGRQMRLNQQLGQLTGALNQQKYMAQLAGGAQAEAGATTRNMINSVNPYASSAFQYRG